MKVNVNIEFKYYLNEAYDNGLKYGILDKNYNIRHPLARCKDYFQDMYWSELTDVHFVKQYGFEWHGGNDSPVSSQKRVNVVLIPDDGHKLKLYKKNILSLLNTIEDHFKIPKSRIYLNENDDDSIVVNYSNKWAKTPYLLSLLFLLMRIGMYYKGEKSIMQVYNWLKNNAKNDVEQPSDKQPLLTLSKTNKWDVLLLTNILPEQLWTDYDTSYYIHDKSGFVSYKFKQEVEVKNGEDIKEMQLV